MKKDFFFEKEKIRVKTLKKIRKNISGMPNVFKCKLNEIIINIRRKAVFLVVFIKPFFSSGALSITKGKDKTTIKGYSQMDKNKCGAIKVLKMPPKAPPIARHK
ncbi:MAG: hypothetical protein IJ846_06325 [Alphaproteobacteria bacterium]|nr:hypothetical protein [Alphaproteobacteria bacterium]